MLFKRGAKKQNSKPGSPKQGAPKPTAQPNKPQANAPKPPVQPNRPQQNAPKKSAVQPRKPLIKPKKPLFRTNKPKPNAKKPGAQPSRPQADPQKPPVQPNRPQANAPKPAAQPNKPRPGITKTPAKMEKRKKFRGGNYSLYYVLGAIVLIIAFVILSNTVLFKCASINVSGNDNYDSDEIILASGINIGDNLVRLKTNRAEDSIVNSLAYIDEAKVKKSFPTKINITVTEAEKIYCVTADGKTAAISRKGKIVELCEPNGLPVVKGYDPETLEVGAWLSSKTDGKSDIPSEVFAAAEKAGLKNITVVDMTDKFNIDVTVEDRVILSLGTSEDIVGKFLVAVEIIDNQLGKDEYVTLLLTNPEKVPVQNNRNPNTVSSSSKPASSSTTSANTEDPVTPAEPADPGEPEVPEEPEPEQPENPEIPEEAQAPENPQE